jgi:hypothetical protein
MEILYEETESNCMIGILPSMRGRQRLIFILGEIF